MARPKRSPREPVVDIPVEDIVYWAKEFLGEIVDEAAEEIIKEAKKNAQDAFKSRSGRMHASIRKRAGRYGKNTVLIGTGRGQGALLEKGHQVTVKKGGVVVGHAKARPYMQPAVDAVNFRLAELIMRRIG